MSDQDEAARQAESLLPCLWPTASEACHVSLLCINCMQRPAVAAALRERDEKATDIQNALDLCDQRRNQLEERIATLDKALDIARNEVADLIISREDLKAENEQLRERIAALEAEVIKAGARVASAASNRFEELEAENERLRAFAQGMYKSR